MNEMTKHYMVKEEIKKWITEGRVSPGEKIHSENELVKLFNVSRHTVRQAIGDLVHEGWLYREQGAGTFCSKRENTFNKNSDKNIGLITTYISDYIFPSIIRGVESVLNSKGYSMIVASTNNDIKNEEQCLKTMLNKNIDGLIVEPTKSAYQNKNIGYYLNLEEKRLPYVMINAFYPELSPKHYAVLDDELGGFIATEHLIKLGHKKIVGAFKTDDLQGLNRMKGFVKAYRKYSLPFFPEMIVAYSTEDKYEKPLSELGKLIKKGKRCPTAIVCYNDELAINVLNFARSFDINIPDELSVVGFDDSYVSEALEVKLTTIKHPKNKMGEDVANKLIGLIEKSKDFTDDESPIIYKPELIIRNSTKGIN